MKQLKLRAQPKDKDSSGLIDYGIQSENSHVRVHVCPRVKRVYVYPTKNGIEAIQTGRYKKKHGFQRGCEEPTSEGYPIPPEEIRNCIEIKVRERAWTYFGFCENHSTAEKGDKAVRMTIMMLKEGLLPIPAASREIKDKDMQVSGTDILVKANRIYHEEIRLQVKCDYPGGRKELGGTGNLYLQTAERNPFKLY